MCLMVLKNNNNKLSESDLSVKKENCVVTRWQNLRSSLHLRARVRVCVCHCWGDRMGADGRLLGFLMAHRQTESLYTHINTSDIQRLLTHVQIYTVHCWEYIRCLDMWYIHEEEQRKWMMNDLDSYMSMLIVTECCSACRRHLCPWATERLSDSPKRLPVVGKQHLHECNKCVTFRNIVIN